MKTRLFLITWSMAILSVASCCPMLSVNPISEPSATETQLEGVWKLDAQDDENVFLHIAPMPENRMAVLMVEHKLGKGLDVQQVPIHLSKLKSGLYINIDTTELPAEEFKNKTGFIFFKIDLKGPDRLITAMLDEKPIIAAIENGALKGELRFKKSTAVSGQSKAQPAEKRKIVECVTITDSSENIRKFLEARDNEPLFTDELRWKRID